MAAMNSPLNSPMTGVAMSGETMMASSTPRIVLQGVNKSYDGRAVLRDIDLSINAKEVVVLLGPSGAGKSTLCRVINRLETIDSGKVLIDGVSLPDGGKALAALRSRVGMVFQSFNLFTHMTVLQNVMCGPVKVLGWPKPKARQKALDLLERVQMSDQANKYPAQLSGGQQQRAAIARSLAMDPTVMLFDEPTSALDPEMIKEVVDVMADLATGGMTMVIVTHEIGFARQCAHRCVFMADGKIVEEGKPAEFFSTPQTARAKEFLKAILP